MKKKKRTLGKALMILMIAFFYLPILYMIIFSFNDGKSLTSFTGFSLRWYQHMLESQDMMTALYTTFSIAILATIVATVVGTVAAIGLSSSRKVIRNIMAAQNGPGCVRVNVEYDVSMTMDQEDSQYQIYGLECDTYGYIGSINMQTEDPLVCSQNLMLTFYMYEQDGQWKIGCLDAESTAY